MTLPENDSRSIRDICSVLDISEPYVRKIEMHLGVISAGEKRQGIKRFYSEHDLKIIGNVVFLRQIGIEFKPILELKRSEKDIMQFLEGNSRDGTADACKDSEVYFETSNFFYPDFKGIISMHDDRMKEQLVELINKKQAYLEIIEPLVVHRLKTLEANIKSFRETASDLGLVKEKIEKLKEDLGKFK